MFEISVFKDEFVINQDGKKTNIPFSNLVSLDFFKHKYGEVYEITGNFISKERVDGFDSYSKKYNEKVVHIFGGILEKYPFKNKNLSEHNPFAHVQNPIFISLNPEYKPDNSAQYINLDYLTGFNIVLDTRKIKDNKLFEVTLDENLNVKTQSLEPITYIGLSVINDESVFASTQSFINALKNIKNTSQKVLDILNFIQQKLKN